MVFPRSFSHIGIAVSDISQAVDFYTHALGCYLIMGPLVVSEGDGSRLGELVGQMAGTGWGRLTVAHLTTPDESGVDLVEIEDAVISRTEPGSCRIAMVHRHAWDPDVGAMARRIIERGGTYCAWVRDAQPDGQPHTVIRCEDPFGNIIEIVASDPERTLSYGAY